MSETRRTNCRRRRYWKIRNGPGSVKYVAEHDGYRPTFYHTDAIVWQAKWYTSTYLLYIIVVVKRAGLQSRDSRIPVIQFRRSNVYRKSYPILICWPRWHYDFFFFFSCVRLLSFVTSAHAWTFDDSNPAIETKKKTNASRPAACIITKPARAPVRMCHAHWLVWGPQCSN